MGKTWVKGDHLDTSVAITVCSIPYRYLIDMCRGFRCSINEQRGHCETLCVMFSLCGLTLMTNGRSEGMGRGADTHKTQTATPTRGAQDARRWAGFLLVMRLSHRLFLQQQTTAFREGRLRGQRFYKRGPASVSKMSNRANILGLSGSTVSQASPDTRLAPFPRPWRALPSGLRWRPHQAGRWQRLKFYCCPGLETTERIEKTQQLSRMSRHTLDPGPVKEVKAPPI